MGSHCTRDYHCDSKVCFGNTCQSGGVDGKCNSDVDCKAAGLSCYRSECRAKAGAGGKCDDQDDCATGATCIEYLCRDPEGVRKHEEKLAAAARKAQAEREARMLAESGVATTPTAEIAAHPPGPGMRVRTVTVTANNDAFAACKPTERLTGGGCKSDYPLLGNYPSGQGAEDTVGARWNCTGNSNADVTAYALCAQLP